MYEYAAVRVAHPDLAGVAGLLARGLTADVAFALLLTTALSIPVHAIGMFSPRAAGIVHRVVLVIVALAGVALIQYFAVNLVPLGADLFGYSLGEIRETVLASKGVDPAAIAAFAAAGAAAWVLSGLTRRIPAPPRMALVLSLLSAVDLAAPRLLAVRPAGFDSDRAFFVAENTLVYFAGESIDALAARGSAGADGAGPYPFYRKVAYDDVLGPLMRTAPQRPNLVLVVVEGLGRDFVGRGARWGGFTPYLDSLSERSLFWENFLSSTGRTFGAFPSLLGSLPFGASGFAELGSRMPYHQSLASLVRERGYTVDYFSGTDGHFDNIDTFLEREGVDRFTDQSSFGRGYDKQPGERGFSWGYADGDLFAHSLELLGAAAREPRLDLYLTITTHEPFIPPGRARLAAEFDRRLAAMPVDPSTRAGYTANRGVFETLLYTDGAIRDFLAAYAKRGDYARTIFVITGDHRLVPVPPATRLDQFRVPFIIWSPLLKAPRRMAAVSTHLDVAPSLLALLAGSYGMHFPDSASWRGTGLDTALAFHGAPPTALMRTKNQLADFVEGTHLLSRGQLYEIDARLDARAVDDAAAQRTLEGDFDRFKRLNRYATNGEHVFPAPPEAIAAAAARAAEDSAIAKLGLAGANPVDAFAAARTAAAKSDYETARVILQHILRDVPNYHDARAMLGRTFGWEHRYADARPVLDEVLRRAPGYAGGWAAMIDLDIWSGREKDALAASDTAISRFPRDAEVLLSRARALEVSGRKADALAALVVLRQVDPSNPDAALVRKRLAR